MHKIMILPVDTTGNGPAVYTVRRQLILKRECDLSCDARMKGKEPLLKIVRTSSFSSVFAFAEQQLVKIFLWLRLTCLFSVRGASTAGAAISVQNAMSLLVSQPAVCSEILTELYQPAFVRPSRLISIISKLFKMPLVVRILIKSVKSYNV